GVVVASIVVIKAAERVGILAGVAFVGPHTALCVGLRAVDLVALYGGAVLYVAKRGQDVAQRVGQEQVGRWRAALLYSHTSKSTFSDLRDSSSTMLHPSTPKTLSLIAEAQTIPAGR